MKQFFKFMFASMFGVILSFIVAALIFSSIIGSIISSAQSEKQPTVFDNSILHIQLENAIQDQPSNNPFENIDFSTFENKTPLSLKNILDNISKAKNDDKIKGIYMDVPYLQANMASIQEIRNALLDFKESGKFIVSYAENFGQGEYYLSSVADEVYLNPAGEMTFKGLGAQLMFFKDALSRLEIEMQVIRHGKFKSAIEPFIREDMSEANKEQMNSLIYSIWNDMSENISKSRNIEVAKLNEIANNLLIRTAKDAVSLGFVDAVKYEDEILEILKEKVGVESEEKLKFIGINKYKKVKNLTELTDSETPSEYYKSKNKIAVIYAEGEIVSGDSKDGQMGSNTIVKAIKKARKDDKIKAIVLRVNSPGGSALASDVMWREVVLAKEVKPVVVSMGGVAASGGYYISCAANKIFAEESTITGSIGVFGLIPNVEGMLKSKIGIDIDRVGTNDYADGLTILRPMKNKEREAIQEMIEDVYGDFTQKVADGRGMTQAEVDSVGQGRVWSGISALKIGLVDEIGGLNAAIAEAVSLADIKDYKVTELPEQEDPFEKLIKDLTNEVRINIFGTEFGMAEKYYSNLKNVLNSKGIYTRLPVDIIIE
ncbi:MAG: signal peptide peptidase SppA [Flavobacteriales bacterium]|nr:signal peptide peptidase SppA [Flavobacteriales bacterium]